MTRKCLVPIISTTAGDTDLVSKDHKNRKRAYEDSNGHVNDDVT